MAKDAPAAKKSRLKQIAQSYRMTREFDPRIGQILAGIFLATAVVVFVILFLAFRNLAYDIVVAALFGVLAALFVFGRRAQKAAYSQIEGKPGAAAAALGMLKRGWKVDAAVSFNKSQDIVHRVVGPPGIVLIGEGNPNRLRTLLANERRKHERVVADTPVFELIAGDGPDEVPIPKLARRVTKLGRNIKPAEMTDVLNRLKALDANRSNLPLPKGPIPTNLKGARQNLRGR
jgi:hypothetical protein